MLFVSAASSLNKLSRRSAQDWSTAGMTHILHEKLHTLRNEKLKTLLLPKLVPFSTFRVYYSKYEPLFQISVKVGSFFLVIGCIL